MRADRFTMNPGHWPIQTLALTVLLAFVASEALSQTGNTSVRLPGVGVLIKADKLTWTSAGWEATGHVEILPEVGGDWWMRADRAIFEGQSLHLEGAHLSAGERSLDAEKLKFNLKSGTISGEGLKATSPVEGGDWLIIRGERFAMREGALVLKEGAVEPSMSAGNIGLRIASEELRLRGLDGFFEAGSGPLDRGVVVRGESVSLSVGGLPVAWLPSLVHPLDGRRAGFLPPEVGFLGGEGIFGGVGGFVPLGAVADLTPRVWGASEGVLAGSLRLRFAQSDRLGQTDRGEVSLEGISGQGRGFSLRGSGALDLPGLPALRHDLALASDGETRDRLRGPLDERLGATARTALMAGPSGMGSALDFGAVLWQPPGAIKLPGQVQGSPSLVTTQALYGLRGALGPVSADLDLMLARFSPLEEDEPEAFVELPLVRTAHRLELATGLAMPVNLWNVARLRLKAHLSHTADIFEVPAERPTELAPTETANRQRMLARVEGRLESHLRSRSVSLRPALTAIVVPVRNTFGDDALPYPTEALDPGLPGLVLHGGVGARKRMSGGAVLHIDVGGLFLSGIEGNLAGQVVEDRASRLGGRARLSWEGAHIRGVVDISPGQGALLREGRLSVGMGEGLWRLEGGATHLEGSERLTVPSWRAPQRLPGILLGGVGGGVRGLDFNVMVPLWPFETVGVGSSALVPLSGGGAEVSGFITVGSPGSGMRLEARATRRASPEVVDALLSVVFD